MKSHFALVGALCLIGTPFGASAATTQAPAYGPLTFLIGHCWKGTVAGTQVTDQHCFSWIYGDKFVRDQHVLHAGAGKPDGLGESIYVWDASSGQLQYLYIESEGGFARGTVSTDGQALVFPPTTYSENGEQQTYRSRWTRSGSDGYDVNTEFLQKDRWVKGFSLHMQRVP
jgi:hypothetical protein